MLVKLRVSWTWAGGGLHAWRLAHCTQPLWIPPGKMPDSTAGGTPAAMEARFLEILSQGIAGYVPVAPNPLRESSGRTGMAFHHEGVLSCANRRTCRCGSSHVPTHDSLPRRRGVRWFDRWIERSPPDVVGQVPLHQPGELSPARRARQAWPPKAPGPTRRGIWARHGRSRRQCASNRTRRSPSVKSRGPEPFRASG
jgi:hypothetical protein